MKRRLLSLILCLCMVLAVPAQTVFATDTTTTEEQSSDSSGSDGSWCTVKVVQGGLGYDAGCTGCTVALIVQNSLTMDSKYQLNGTYNSKTSDYTNFENVFIPNAGVQSGTYYLVSLNDSFMSWQKDYCGDSFSVPSEIADYSENSYTWKTLVGMGGKDFVDMTNEELVDAMSVLWNNGYWVVVAVAYVKEGVDYIPNISKEKFKSDPDKWQQCTGGNGSGDYTSRHWTMLAGVDSNDIYINDPANGKITKLSESKASSTYNNYPYKLVYVSVLENSKNTPIALSGGKKAGNSDGTNSLGIDENVFLGLDPDGLASYCTLAEVDLTGLFDEASIDNLNNQELTGLQNWKDNKEANEGGFISFGRKMVALFGILMILYAVLLYLGYWFDKINVYFNLDMVGILSFKKLKVSDNEEECTFSLTDQPKSEARTINHKYLVLICVMLIAFGVLLVSGMMYVVISGVVTWVRGLFG